MKSTDYLQVFLFLGLLGLGIPLLGGYMARVFDGQKSFMSLLLRPLERGVYRLCGIDEGRQMDWKGYATSLVLLNLCGLVFLVAIQLLQHHLPMNPQKLPQVPLLLAVNTAISFVTNTNWQAYSGESTLSYLVQCLGLTVQNFLSAATGMGVLLVFIRGLKARHTRELGNYWVDITRTTVYLLLPLSILAAIVLMGQGVVQSFIPYVEAHTLEGVKQLIPLGPAASQIAIKQLGTNGGGFFGVNSAHPFENPTGLSNMLEMVFILLIPAATTYMYGLMVGSRRQGMVILLAMAVIFLTSLGLSLWAESQPDPSIAGLPLWEGKETRLGMVNSVIWSQATTVASNGSVNAMHSSMSPVTSGLAMWNMALGEVVFGGVGSGLYGMLLFVLITVFIAGLMVGRTPEYLGKKIQSGEIKWSAVAIILPSAAVLSFVALSLLCKDGLAALSHRGPHGLSEILYAFISAANNNGSSFGGLNANTVFYNVTTSFAMLIGRFGVILPVLAISGSLAAKGYTPPSVGTFPTDGTLFVVLLIAIVVIIGGLTFFPALSLGPLCEELLMLQGRVF